MGEGFVDCVSCGKPVSETEPHRRGRSGVFHADCPCPDQRRQGLCSACDTIYSLGPVVDLAGNQHWTLPVHWRPTRAQLAVGRVCDAMALWNNGQKMLSLPGGGVRCDDFDVLWQQDECPGSLGFAPEQWESYVTKGGRFSGPGVVLEPWNWALEQLEALRRRTA